MDSSKKLLKRSKGVKKADKPERAPTKKAKMSNAKRHKKELAGLVEIEADEGEDYSDNEHEKSSRYKHKNTDQQRYRKEDLERKIDTR